MNNINKTLQGESGPLKILQSAVVAVPAVKYALGVAGIAAAIAIIKALLTDLKLAVFGVALMFIMMVVLFIFAKLVTIASKDIRTVLLAAIWFSLFIFIATNSALFLSVFFRWPVDLQYWIAKSPENSPKVDVEPATRNNPELSSNSATSMPPQEYELRGEVRNANIGIPSADITEINSAETTKSDQNGKFVLRVKRQNSTSLRLRVFKLGYEIWEEYVEATDGIIIQLQRKTK